MILQRCLNQECRNYFKLDLRACPRCALPVPPGLRFLAFRKKINGKKYYRNIGRVPLAEAEQKHLHWQAELLKPSPKRNEETTTREMTDAYLAKMEIDGKTYHRKAKLFFDRLVEFADGRRIARALDLTDADFRKLQTILRQTASPAYVDRHLAMYKAAWFHQFGRSVPNPVSAVKFYHPDNKLVRFLSNDEVEKLLAAAAAGRNRIARWGGPWFFHEILVVALNTGLRERNILDLHVAQVDFKERVISLTAKGGYSITKDMNQVVFDTLSKIWTGDSGYFFASHRTGKPFARITGAWEYVKKQAGITRPFRFHDLRHHFGTMLGEQTGNPRLVMEAMDHRNMSTTMRYFHQNRETLREALEEYGRRTPKSPPMLAVAPPKKRNN